MRIVSLAFGDLRFAPVLTDPPVMRQILEHLDLPVRPPALAAARGPRQQGLLSVDLPSPFDLGPAASASDRDPFDQSLPGDDGTGSA
jgi:hypothetical protein